VRRLQGHQPVGVHRAQLARQGGVHRQPRQRALAPEVPARSPRDLSEEGAPDPVEGERLSSTSAASTRVSRRVSRCSSPTAVLRGRRPGRAVPRPTFRSGPSSAHRPEPALQNHRRAMSRTVRRSTSEPAPQSR
jgi:hypothetical protein